MDKLETFKAILPFIPPGYRRPLLLFIHIEELMRIVNSLQECMRRPISTQDACPMDISKLTELLNHNSRQSRNDNSDMLNLLLPLLMAGAGSSETGGSGISEILGNLKDLGNMSDIMSGLSGNLNRNIPDNDKVDNENFSAEIDDLFKDFLEETGNE